MRLREKTAVSKVSICAGCYFEVEDGGPRGRDRRQGRGERREEKAEEEEQTRVEWVRTGVAYFERRSSDDCRVGRQTTEIHGRRAEGRDGRGREP